MPIRLSRLAPPALFALIATFAVAWDGMLTIAFTDYEREAEPAVTLLTHGQLGGFLDHLPAYGGSLIMRAPFALLPGLWHGGTTAAFRSLAAPCLLAAVILGLTLWSRLDTAGRRRGAWLALALCVANPITLRALDIGHPEELLGACLCAAAVLVALDARPGLAGVLLGLALANKAWAVLAIPPVLLALRGGRIRAGLIASGVAAVALAPMLLHASPGIATARSVATGSGAGFTPQQLWWFLGSHDHVVVGVQGAMPGYRVPPDWIVPIGHLLVIAVGVALSGAWWWRARRSLPARSSALESSRRRGDPLLLLALVMLMRCLVDPWDMIYYTLPFLLALAAWEAVARRRAPVVALASTAGIWVSWELATHSISPDLQALVFALFSAPLAGLLGWRLYAPASFGQRWEPLEAWVRHQLPTLATFGADASVDVAA